MKYIFLIICLLLLISYFYVSSNTYNKEITK